MGYRRTNYKARQVLVSFGGAPRTVLTISPSQTRRPEHLGVASRSGFNSARSLSRDMAGPHKSGGWEARGFLNWTGLGVIAGGLAGGIWAGMQIAHSDDPMLANWSGDWRWRWRAHRRPDWRVRVHRIAFTSRDEVVDHRCRAVRRRSVQSVDDAIARATSSRAERIAARLRARSAVA